LLATITTTFPIEADTAIEAIENWVRQSVAHQPTESCSRVLRAFCSEISEQNLQLVKFSSTMHCETALAALARYGTYAIDDRDMNADKLKKLVKV
jgi:hypothetical protein